MVINEYSEEVLERKIVTDLFSWFEAVTVGLKSAWKENDSSPESDTHVKKVWIRTSLPPCFFMPCIEVPLL
jgi:hypothetical protein